MAGISPDTKADSKPVNGVWDSFTYAWDGLKHAWRSQRNFRLECYIACLVLALSLWLGVGLVEVLLLVLVVLTLELINTALEAVVDLASPTPHPLAKAAKDTAAAAVLVSSLFSILIGAALFLKPLLEKLGFAF